MYAIIKKELNYYFTSTVGYVFLAVFCLVGGWFFITSNLINLNGDVGLIFSNMSSAFLFIIPILTMSITAQEIRYGTDILLHTSHLLKTNIAAGKFLAVLIVYMLALLSTCIYPLILLKFTTPDFGVFLGNLIGFFLMGAALISIGMFISTITTHQVTAAISTFAILLVMYLLDWLSPAFSGGYAKFIIEFFAVSKRFHLFSEGYLNIKDAVYYISITLIFIFFSVVKMKKDRSLLGKIAVLLAIITFFSVNLLADYLCGNYIKTIDLTNSGVIELSDETEEILEALDEDVNIYSFVPEGENDGVLITMDEILKKYKQESDRITYERIDVEKNPEFAKKYLDLGSSISLYSVVFECGDKFRVINISDAVSFNADSGTLENIMAEQYFTSAIIKITSDEAQKVAIISGHGERIDERVLSNIFELNNYEVSTVNLLTDDINDKALIIITNPETDYSQEEILKLDEFLKSGGAAEIFIGPDDKGYKNLYSYLNEWGIEFSGGYLVDNKKGNYVQSKVYLLPEINDTEITENFADKGFNILMPYSRAVNIRQMDGIIHQVLLETSEDARNKYNIRSTTATFEEGDKDGKFTIAAYLERKIGDISSEIMVVGNTAFINNEYVNQSQFINSEFVLRGAKHLTENENTVNISPKKIGNTLLDITASDVIRSGLLTVVVIPLLIAAAGVLVWLKRRKI